MPCERLSTSYEQMFQRELELAESERMDFVVIATPTPTHFAIAYQALLVASDFCVHSVERLPRRVRITSLSDRRRGEQAVPVVRGEEAPLRRQLPLLLLRHGSLRTPLSGVSRRRGS